MSHQIIIITLTIIIIQILIPSVRKIDSKKQYKVYININTNINIINNVHVPVPNSDQIQYVVS